MDGAGVAGQGLNVASEFVPNEYGQGIVKTILKYLNVYNVILCNTSVVLYTILCMIIIIPSCSELSGRCPGGSE